MNLIRNIKDKFKWAFEGLIFGIKQDRSIQIQCSIAIIAIVMSLVLKFETRDFIIVLILCSIVIVAEFLNSSIERLSDYACDNEYSENIKRIKDLAAAAVLVASICAFIVGVITFYGYIF